MCMSVLRFLKGVAYRVLSCLTLPRTALFFGKPFFWLLGMRRKRWEINLSQVKRALVVRLDEIGDVVMTTPFLRELRRNLPYAWITLVVKPQVYNLVEFCPYVNEVLTYNWNIGGHFGRLRRHFRTLRFAWQHLWKRRFNLALLPRWDVDYYNGTFVTYLSGAPWRVGYSENVNMRKKNLNNGFDRLFTHSIYENKSRHEIEHNLDVIRFLGGKIHEKHPEVWLEEKDVLFADEIFEAHEVLPNDLLIGIAPGARDPKRCWPLSSFGELGIWLREEYNARILVTGGPEEESLGNTLEQELGNIINVVGKTTLRQAAALLKRCQLFIGNDSGLMHIAAAVGVPVIELTCHPKSGSPYSYNSPVRFRPWGDNHTIIRPETSIPPCIDECIARYPHCILGITIEKVKEALKRKFTEFEFIRSKLYAQK